MSPQTNIQHHNLSTQKTKKNKNKNKKKYRERERVLLLNTRKWSLGLFLDWSSTAMALRLLGVSAFSNFCFPFYFWSQSKKYKILLEKTEVTTQHSKSNDLKSFNLPVIWPKFKLPTCGLNFDTLST